jgi:hypothetical protein
MVTSRRSVTKGRWSRGFIVAFLASTAAVMFIALSGCYPKTAIIDVKDEKNNPKKMMITYDRNMKNISATVDGKNIEVSKPHEFPIVLGGHTKRIVGIYPGPMIVFEGSSCIWFNNRWIGYPPGTVCP